MRTGSPLSGRSSRYSPSGTSWPACAESMNRAPPAYARISSAYAVRMDLQLRHAGEAPDAVVEPASVKDHHRHSDPVRHRPQIALQILLRDLPRPEIEPQYKCNIIGKCHCDNICKQKQEGFMDPFHSRPFIFFNHCLCIPLCLYK